MTRLDPDGWMLAYARRRRVRLAGETGVKEHYQRRLRGEPTEHSTGYEAGVAAAIAEFADVRREP